MEIVLDTNILISSLLRNGLTRDIIFLSPFRLTLLFIAQQFAKCCRKQTAAAQGLPRKDSAGKGRSGPRTNRSTLWSMSCTNWW